MNLPLLPVQGCSQICMGGGFPVGVVRVLVSNIGGSGVSSLRTESVCGCVVRWGLCSWFRGF